MAAVQGSVPGSGEQGVARGDVAPLQLIAPERLAGADAEPDEALLAAPAVKPKYPAIRAVPLLRESSPMVRRQSSSARPLRDNRRVSHVTQGYGWLVVDLGCGT